MPTLAVNKRASFDYEILDRYETGLVLLGNKIKSVKAYLIYKTNLITTTKTTPPVLFLSPDLFPKLICLKQFFRREIF